MKPNNTLHQILRNLTLELRKGDKLQFGMMVIKFITKMSEQAISK